MEILIKLFKSSVTRSFLLWITGIQMVIYLLVTVAYIAADIYMRPCDNGCVRDKVELELLQGLNLVPLFLSIILIIGLVRNDLRLLRVWLFTIIGSSILIIFVLVSVIVYAANKRNKYFNWYMYIPLIAELLLLLYTIVCVFEYYNTQKRLNTITSFNQIETNPTGNPTDNVKPRSTV